jgi:Transposase DDE domain
MMVLPTAIVQGASPMPSITHLETAVETLLAESLPTLPRATRQRLVAFLLGVLLAGTVVLRRVATTQAHFTPETATAASHERRLRRTLNDAQLGPAVPLYGRVLRRVLRRVPADRRLTLILDESGHSTVVRVLLAALWYRGRAIPLCWVLWPCYQPHPQSYWADCADLLAQAAALLPAGVPVTVLADRAFGCPGFTDLVVAQSWQYVVRVQGQTRLRQADGSEQALNTLVRQAGSYWYGSGAVFKKEGWRPASVLAYWRTGCKEPLLLVSNHRAGLGLVRWYRLRGAIEALFRDWKTSGWQWEASQVRDVGHQAVVVLVLALATLLTLCLGEEVAQQVLAQAPQQGQRRPWHARDSLFRLGRDRLWQRVWQDDQSSIAWELADAGSENWSETCWRKALPEAIPVLRTGRVGTREYQREPI